MPTDERRWAGGESSPTPVVASGMSAGVRRSEVD